jgi:hypothetical protein
VIQWNDSQKARLLACRTDKQLQRAFPKLKLGTLKNRRRQILKEQARQLMRTAATFDEERAVHIVIPDTQIKPGVPTDHLRWIGQYIVDHFAGQVNVRIIHLGDHADMPSLSSYDKGKRAMEGRRYLADIDAANAGFDALNQPLIDYNVERRAAGEPEWWPDRHIALGNHEDRITRACESDAQLDGLMSLDSLNYADHGWMVHPFLQPFYLDGIGYVHYWTNHMTGRPLGGMVSTRIKTIGHSFTMGHQQTLDTAVRFIVDPETGESRGQWGLVVGACYLHDEDYKGFQGNAHWRGIVVCHGVYKGEYNPMFVDLNYLCRRYEGMNLAQWKARQIIA